MYNIFRKLPILIIFQYGNLKDFLMKLLNLLVHLITLGLSNIGDKTRVKFAGSFLKQDKIKFSHGNGKYINCL